MFMFELVIGLLLVGAVLSLWAARLGVPYPALLALSGAALALLPGTPDVALDPELALALFVAPALLDAAFDASPRDLKAHLSPVLSLALAAVGLTIAAVAVVARLFFPDLGWAAAIALGAIVAPPDAAAATAVLRQVRPPHRVLVILEGESLFNDASALLVYRIAVAAAMTGAFSGWNVLPVLALTSGGGIIAGVILAHLYLRMVDALMSDVGISVLTQFISTFAVWIIAEILGVSAILAVVAYAMTVARYAPARINARHRIASYAVWEVTVFVLNALAFVLIGLQLRGIMTRLRGADWNTYVLCALAVCAAAIVTRIVWVMLHNTVARWRIARSAAPPPPSMQPTLASGIVVSWCGMRGIVTLATALALPEGFPYRDLIVLCAFSVVLTTLVVQGLTLRPLLERLAMPDDRIVERELGIARAETARLALRALERESPQSASLLRPKYEARLQSGEELSATGHAEGTPPNVVSIQRRLVEAQRQALSDLRARQVIGDDAFHLAEEEVDLLELTADPRVSPQM